MADLVWLPGVGATSDVTGAVSCETVYLTKDNYLSSWISLFNSETGLFRTGLRFTDGSNKLYGLPMSNAPSGSRNINMTMTYDELNPVSGMWGYEDSGVIKSIAPISLNLTECPMPTDPSGSSSSSNNSSSDPSSPGKSPNNSSSTPGD